MQRIDRHAICALKAALVKVHKPNRLYSLISGRGSDWLGSPWGWRCVNETCVKEEKDPHTILPDLDTCKLTCARGSVIWPRPTGLVRIGKEEKHACQPNIFAVLVAG
ncbi:hypothetical protein E2C01_021721 [Portunus trituberculatus]|uniref:Uncharacterized protein n=1 Tax=Portunus trituberculatus TaxID=210409 RepID=A0A5B7E5P1_PORTR|nr:hypothetical protein [Portunus trituberculatus]